MLGAPKKHVLKLRKQFSGNGRAQGKSGNNPPLFRLATDGGHVVPGDELDCPIMGLNPRSGNEQARHGVMFCEWHFTHLVRSVLRTLAVILPAHKSAPFRFTSRHYLTPSFGSRQITVSGGVS